LFALPQLGRHQKLINIMPTGDKAQKCALQIKKKITRDLESSEKARPCTQRGKSPIWVLVP
jgi:hypothetical protein